MKSKISKVSAILIACLILIGMLPANIAVAAGDIPIDEAYFPDANFRNFALKGNWFDDCYCEHKIDADSNGFLSEAEIAPMIELNLDYQDIVDLTGIEYFTPIEYLYCRDPQLKTLDISKNTELRYLHCSNNLLTNLDLSQNDELRELNCGNNPFSYPRQPIDTFNEDSLPYLWEFGCEGLGLTELDLTPCSGLRALNCSGNLLTSLDLSNNYELTKFDCGSNHFSDPHQPFETLSKKAASCLKELGCEDLGLTEFDLSKYIGLRKLKCTGNQLTNLDISSNIALTELECSSNQLTGLDISNNTVLEEFECSGCSYLIHELQYDPAGLPEGFDLNKASDWQNCTVEGNILTFNDVNSPVKYTYDCGNGYKAEFSLCTDAKPAPEITEEPTIEPQSTDAPQPTKEPSSTHEPKPDAKPETGNKSVMTVVTIF